MGRKEYLDLLARVPLFAQCSKAELRALSARASYRSVAVGRVLVREGEPGTEFYVIVDGEAEVVRRGAVVDRLGPGGFFGELSLLDPAPRDATVTASSELDLLTLTQDQFEAVLVEAPGLTRNLLTGMARRLREHDRRGWS